MLPRKTEECLGSTDPRLTQTPSIFKLPPLPSGSASVLLLSGDSDCDDELDFHRSLFWICSNWVDATKRRMKRTAPPRKQRAKSLNHLRLLPLRHRINWESSYLQHRFSFFIFYFDSKETLSWPAKRYLFMLRWILAIALERDEEVWRTSRCWFDLVTFSIRLNVTVAFFFRGPDYKQRRALTLDCLYLPTVRGDELSERSADLFSRYRRWMFSIMYTVTSRSLDLPDGCRREVLLGDRSIPILR